LIFPQL